MSSLLCSRRNNTNKKQQDDGEPQPQPQISISTPPTPATMMRKGPWTDEEDEQLVRFVRLFGERRWDFLAKVSGLRGGGWASIDLRPSSGSGGDGGLRRTGKSCRLRWVNYLHPGLRRGRITADEERRIVELHAQWGSRWSRIARSLPGRTDNEIKNFWRTRTRKQKALQERTAAELAAASSFSVTTTTTTSECRRPGSSSSSSPTSGAASTASSSSSGSGSSSLRGGRCGGDGDDDAELEEACTHTAAAPAATKHEHPQPQLQEYMDQLWNEIAAADAAAMSYVVDACWGGAGAGGHYYYGAAAAEPPPASPPWEWEYCGSDFSLWRIDDQEYYKKMLDSS